VWHASRTSDRYGDSEGEERRRHDQSAGGSHGVVRVDRFRQSVVSRDEGVGK